MENLIARSHEEKSLYKYILPIFQKTPFELVRIRIFGNSNYTLQIMVDHTNRPLTIDDCAKVSRIVSDELDKQDLVQEEYKLEVSSPGLNRPLTRLKDFDSWKGHKVIVKQKSTNLQMSKFEGILVGVINSELHLVQNDQIHQIEICNIDEAKLVA